MIGHSRTPELEEQVGVLEEQVEVLEEQMEVLEEQVEVLRRTLLWHLPVYRSHSTPLFCIVTN